jgi:hypothetical protein
MVKNVLNSLRMLFMICVIIIEWWIIAKFSLKISLEASIVVMCSLAIFTGIYLGGGINEQN